MTSISPVSPTELTQRRQKLRRQRRLRVFQAIWRNVAIIGLTGGLFWAATLPDWVIRQPEQIKIEGNRYIPTPTLRALLPIAYPQSLLRLQPQELSNVLKAKAPIAEVTVKRQVFPFPPRLTIQVKERYPVAIAQSGPGENLAANRNQNNIGLLDENGLWIPLESYTSLDESLKLPTLKVFGKQEQYRSDWAKLYQEIRRSPVKITEVDWRDPNNLILKTDLGIVHFGAYSPSFANQLRTLDRMRQLPTSVNPSQIEYIDLHSPDTPYVQMLKPKKPVKPDLP